MTAGQQPSGIAPKPMYRVLFPLLRVVLSIPDRFVYHGAEHIPNGAAILAGNHTSNLDPFSIAFVLPVSRPISFMAKAEMFATPLTNWFFRSVHQFPVNRGAVDRTAIRQAVDILKNGGLLGIFPQGTRSATGDVAQAQSGVAFIALQADAPIVPVGIVRGERRFGRRRVDVTFRPAITPADFAELSKRERVDAMTARVVEGINQAIRTTQRGAAR